MMKYIYLLKERLSREGIDCPYCADFIGKTTFKHHLKYCEYF